MASIELSGDDAALLAEVLTQVLADLRYEIADTDNYDFRQELHGRHDRLQAIASQLGVEPASD